MSDRGVVEGAAAPLDALAQSVALAGARRLAREWLDVEGVPRALVPILSALTAPEPQRYPGLRLDEYAAQAQAWLDAHLPHAMTDEPCVPCQMATNLILVCGSWFEAEGWQADEWAALVADREALLEHIRQLEKQLLGGNKVARSGGDS